MKTYHLSTKQIMVFSALIIVVGVVFLYFMGAQYGIKYFVKPEASSTPEAIVNAQIQAVVSRADAAIAKAEASLVEEKPSVPAPLTAQKLPVAWAAADVKTPAPSIPLSEKVIDYEMVKVDPHPVNLPGDGDQIVMPMLKGQSVTVNVESVTVNPNGDYTWTGHLQGRGSDYPVVMTYGEHSTFATITTPSGSYSMESLDGSGWLYKNPAMPEVAAPGTTDFREVNLDR